MARVVCLSVWLLGAVACAPAHKPVEPTPVPTPTPVVEVDPPRIALVLGGGGARGFAHVGVLRALEQEKIQVDLIVGTSVGSLIGALYAAEPNTFELEWKAFKLEKEDIFDFSILSAARGAVKGEAIKRFLKENFPDPEISHFEIPFIAIATDINTGQRIEIRNGSVVDAVRASTAIPGIFTPAKIADRVCVDGGVVANVAVDTARANGADIVIASNIGKNVVDYNVSDAVSVTLQAIEIMMGEMATYQLENADVVVSPAIGDVGTMDFSQKKRCMQAGIEATRAQVDNIKEAIRQYYVERGGVPPDSLGAANSGSGSESPRP